MRAARRATAGRLSGDDRLVRRTARGLALQSALLVGAAMLLLVVLVTVVVVRGQQQADDAALRTAAATADDVGDPPASSWIVFDQGGQVTATGGLPDDLGGSLAALRTRPTTRPVLAQVSDQDGEHYRVLTEQRRGRVVQVVLDLRPQREGRARLYRAMAAAAGLALVAAAAMGALLGRRAVRPLVHALALQRTFVADASHELRTPLTLLSTRVQLLDRQLRAAAPDPQVLQDSQAVVRDVQRLGDVVEDLLVAADPRRDEQHSSVNLGQLLDDVAGSAAPHAATVGVSVTVVQRAAEDPPLTLAASGPALRRAVLALVDNAIDHTPPGGQVLLRSSRQAQQVVIAVSDTGPGIPAGAAPHVLRRFSSGGQRAGRQHYGLGLALTSDVADRHGGRLRLAPGTDGTTFELVLPVRAGTQPAES